MSTSAPKPGLRLFPCVHVYLPVFEPPPWPFCRDTGRHRWSPRPRHTCTRTPQAKAPSCPAERTGHAHGETFALASTVTVIAHAALVLHARAPRLPASPAATAKAIPSCFSAQSQKSALSVVPQPAQLHPSQCLDARGRSHHEPASHGLHGHHAASSCTGPSRLLFLVFGLHSIATPCGQTRPLLAAMTRTRTSPITHLRCRAPEP